MTNNTSIKSNSNSSRSKSQMRQLEAQETADMDSSEACSQDDPDNEDDNKERDTVAELLLLHAFHLPGNNWTQDLWQYLTNNHPLFGICLHHRHHPLSWKLRVASLIGSVLFGLALTNVVYLAFVFASENEAFDKEYYTLETNATRTGLSKDFDDTVSSLSVTNGNIVLWTAGALLHGFYDNTIWALATCQCFRSKTDSKQTSTTGAFLIMLSVVVVTAVASFAVMLRAALDADSTTTTTTAASPNIMDSGNQVHAQFEVLHQQEFKDYEFIVSYFVELILTYVVYYPVAGTILFSGIVSGGRMPLTGGRPYELKQAREAKAQLQLQEQQEAGDVEVEWKSTSLRNKKQQLSGRKSSIVSDGSESKTSSDHDDCGL